jgi:SAM-dependent methyltransferase
VSEAEGIPGALESGYAERYAELYGRHWWWRAREEAVVREVSRLLRADGGARGGSTPAILDVGCGDGLLFPRLDGMAEVEGVEPDARLVSGRWGARVHVVPFERFVSERRYTLILMLDVLEHLADPAAALARARDLLRPGGRVLLTVPAFNLLWTTHDEINHHFTRYRMDTLARVVRDAGLRVERGRYLFHWLFAAKLLVRAREVASKPEARAPSVPPRAINAALYAACRLEQRLARPLRLPFGSSLMVTCRADGAG